MTGPEHYREAERLIAEITHAGALLPQSRVLNAGDHGGVLAWAQVHATLALAAATALPNVGEMFVVDHDAWCDAVSAHPATPDRAS